MCICHQKPRRRHTGWLHGVTGSKLARAKAISRSLMASANYGSRSHIAARSSQAGEFGVFTLNFKRQFFDLLITFVPIKSHAVRHRQQLATARPPQDTNTGCAGIKPAIFWKNAADRRVEWPIFLCRSGQKKRYRQSVLCRLWPSHQMRFQC